MFRELLYLVVSNGGFALGAGLILAWPLVIFARRVTALKTGFWRSYFFLVGIDIVGQLAAIIVFMIFYGLRPTVSTDPMSWIVTTFCFLIISYLLSPRIFPYQERVLLSNRKKTAVAVGTTILIQIKNAAILGYFLFNFEQMTQM